MPFEHIEHTADVMLHVWGPDLSSTLEDSVRAMSGLMVGSLSTVVIDEKLTFDVEARGRDLPDALFHLLDEFLFSYGSTYTITSEVRVFEARQVEEDGSYLIRARGWGGKYNPSLHAGGTEVKAVTMNNLTLLQKGENMEWHATFVLDI